LRRSGGTRGLGWESAGRAIARRFVVFNGDRLIVRAEHRQQVALAERVIAREPERHRRPAPEPRVGIEARSENALLAAIVCGLRHHLTYVDS
jgi:hypothetical protein